MSTPKRSGHITADITTARIREALAAGHKVYVQGHDGHYGLTLRGYAQCVEFLPTGDEVAFIDETPDGPFQGKRVGLYVRDLSEVQIG